MSTNYHLKGNGCECCGRSDAPVHIGKSVRGWCFSLRVGGGLGAESLDGWRALWGQPGCVIVDEYGDTLTPEEMLSVVTEREAWGEDCLGRDAGFQGVEVGPDGLYRYEVDGRHCVGHGDGPWDLIAAEFD